MYNNQLIIKVVQLNWFNMICEFYKPLILSSISSNKKLINTWIQVLIKDVIKIYYPSHNK